MSAPRIRDPLWMRVLLAPFWAVAFVIGTPITFLSLTVFRGRCPNCQRRGLRGVRCSSAPEIHDGDVRPFGFSECVYCHHQFHELPDKPIIHIPPADPRYTHAS